MFFAYSYDVGTSRFNIARPYLILKHHINRCAVSNKCQNNINILSRLESRIYCHLYTPVSPTFPYITRGFSCHSLQGLVNKT